MLDGGVRAHRDVIAGAGTGGAAGAEHRARHRGAVRSCSRMGTSARDTPVSPTSPRPPSSPGHSWVPQGSSCTGGPSQKSPWPWGVGLEQARLRLRTPAPQLRLQPLQGLQGLQPPGPVARGGCSAPGMAPQGLQPPRGLLTGTGLQEAGVLLGLWLGAGCPGVRGAEAVAALLARPAGGRALAPGGPGGPGGLGLTLCPG